MAMKFLGKKRGMTQRFDEKGNSVVCTIIHSEPNVVTQIKRKESDGYDALQLGFEKIITKDPRTVGKRISKQLIGHFQKNGIDPRRHLAEARVDNIDDYTVGQELDLSLFAEAGYVDVQGVSKGKGYQGVMKRHNFKGGPGAHGSKFHRLAGSTGMRSTPGRCLPGGKKAGRMGGKVVTVESLKIVGVDVERNLLIVQGAIPGPTGALVSFSPAKKKKK